MLNFVVFSCICCHGGCALSCGLPCQGSYDAVPYVPPLQGSCGALSCVLVRKVMKRRHALFAKDVMKSCHVNVMTEAVMHCCVFVVST